ncbi:MAG: hypothetical protein IPM01_31590 [Burkholderiaceae bacterium]|nr:hypothetical protein [Burkholderiaceae bacterium]
MLPLHERQQPGISATLGYLPLEYVGITVAFVGEKADVYAAGLVMIEMLRAVS